MSGSSDGNSGRTRYRNMPQGLDQRALLG
jgi:hypothetical protein